MKRESKRRTQKKTVVNPSTASEKSRHPPIVLPLHGIRTRGDWVKLASNTLGGAGNSTNGASWHFRLENWSYGYFSLIQFLSPWSRSAKVYWFRSRYTVEVSDKANLLDAGREGGHPTVIAHSFGTYILGNALLAFPNIRLNKVILVGAILPRSFPWKEIVARGQVQAVRNEYGLNDVWTKISSWVIPGTGASGSYGFYESNFPADDERFEQAEFTSFKHSDYFERLHINEYWRPFLDKTIASIPMTSASQQATINTKSTGDRHRTQVSASFFLFMLVLISLILAINALWHRVQVKQPDNKTVPSSVPDGQLQRSVPLSFDGETPPWLKDLCEVCESHGWDCEVRNRRWHTYVRVEPSSGQSATGWSEIRTKLKDVESPVELCLSVVPAGGLPLSELSGLAGLRRLELRLNHTLITPNELGMLTQLTELVLTDCDHVDDFRADAFDRTVFQNIRVLGLSGSASWIDSLEDLDCFPNLVELDLSNRKGPVSLDGIEQFKQLENLSLRGVQEITNVHKVSGCASLSNLHCHRYAFPKSVAPIIPGFEARLLPQGGVEFARLTTSTPVSTEVE